MNNDFKDSIKVELGNSPFDAEEMLLLSELKEMKEIEDAKKILKEKEESAR